MEKTYAKSPEGLLEITTTQEVTERRSLKDLRARVRELREARGNAKTRYDQEVAEYVRLIAAIEADIAKALELKVPEEPAA